VRKEEAMKSKWERGACFINFIKEEEEEVVVVVVVVVVLVVVELRTRLEDGI
jgi:hypothetical protein